jgi:hypothetical protein
MRRDDGEVEVRMRVRVTVKVFFHRFMVNQFTRH